MIKHLRIDDQWVEQLAAVGMPGADGGAGMRDLYARSSRLELPLLDYLTIRDLLELGGCEGDQAATAVLMSLFAALEEGSLCLSLEEDLLKTRLMEFLDAEPAAKTIASFLKGLSEGRYERLITRNCNAYLPLVLSEKGGASLLYFQKFYVHESLLRERMEALLHLGTEATGSVSDQESIIDAIYGPGLSIRTGKRGNPIDRDPIQEEALRLALRSRFSIISGGPGTGKTSLMVNILRCLVRSGIRAEDILLGAPTGLAAQRMTEAIRKSIETIESPDDCDRDLLNLKGNTLHRLLGYRRSHHDFYFGEGNPLPASAIVLDEVSMVDLIMMERFLRAVRPIGTRLIFLGDKDQLPSVEAGAVFADMIPDGKKAERFKDRLVVLETVYRSGKNLVQLAGDVNRGDFPDFKTISFASGLDLPPDQWGLVKDEGGHVWRRRIHQWVDRHYLAPLGGDGLDYVEWIEEAGRMDSGDLAHSEAGKEILGRVFEKVRQVRVLSLLRNGLYGCTGINQEIAIRLASRSGHSHPGQPYFPGAMIMITRNDYARGLFNGDVGVVIQDRDGAFRTWFPRLDGYFAFSMDLLPPWEQAFAMTVHKSQGSEFDDVLLVLPPDENHRLLSREIVYTGITRARKRVIIYGSVSALKAALSRRMERRSGLGW